jgi:hypothetical protein
MFNLSPSFYLAWNGIVDVIDNWVWVCNFVDIVLHTYIINCLNFR